MATQWELAAARPFLNVIIGRLATELEGRYQLWKSIESESSSLKRAVDLLAAAMDDQLCRCRDDPLRAAGLSMAFTEQMRNLTHDIEDCIERFLHRVTCNKGASWAHQALHSVKMYRSRHKFATKMKALRKRLDETTNQIQIFKIPTVSGQSSSTARSGAEPAHPDNPVGIEDAKKELLALLVEPNPEMVISIVGFGGSGKTTLARAVYESVHQEAPSCRAWVAMHSLDADGILREIHRQLLPSPREEYSAASLKAHLTVSANRYLIVIDDIKWEHINHLDTLWHTLKGNGTIIVTTAIQSVANTCSNLCLQENRHSFGYVYRMRSLGEEDSRKIAFPRRHTPEFLIHSAALLNKCDGLPLALASVARKLSSESEPTGEFCKDLCRDLGRYVEHETDRDPFFARLRGVLMDNYISLPDYTARTCLLYLSIFQAHRPLQRKVIIRRWSAEGYVRNNPLDEDPMVADRNFKMLIDSNIIQPDVPRHSRREKTWKTHGIMHVFLLHKSRRQNFITPYGVEYKKVRHLFVHDNNDDTNFRKKFSLDLSCVRSLTVSGSAGDAIADFCKYKVMRVLDLEGSTDLTDDHLQSICKLWNLRYLSLGPNITNLPKEIAHLRLLETLDISKTKVDVLPVEVIGLPCLINLIGKFKLADLVGTDTCELEEQSKESKLETLVGFVADGRNGLLELMVHMKSLNKVKIWCEPDDKGQGFDQLLVQLNNHLLEAIKKYCRAPIQKTRSLSIDFRRLTEGSLYALTDLYNHSLGSETKYYLTSLKLHGNSSALHEFVSLFPYVTELALSPTNVTLDLLLALSKMQCLLYLKLKFDDIESFVIQAGHFESLRCLRLVWHATDLILPVIEDGALPDLVSFQLICKSLVGLSGNKITHLKQLKEIALHSQVASETREQWEEAAREHPQRPNVLTFTRMYDTKNEDTVPEHIETPPAAPLPPAPKPKVVRRLRSFPGSTFRRSARLGIGSDTAISITEKAASQIAEHNLDSVMVAAREAQGL